MQYTTTKRIPKAVRVTASTVHVLKRIAGIRTYTGKLRRYGPVSVLSLRVR